MMKRDGGRGGGRERGREERVGEDGREGKIELKGK